jgi:hypothetical protein
MYISVVDFIFHFFHIALDPQSYGGGRDLWCAGTSKESGRETTTLATHTVGHDKGGSNSKPTKKPKFVLPSISDGIMELVAFQSVAGMGCVMACNKFGAGAKRICQVTAARIKITQPTYLQIDGEPWLQQPGVVELTFFDQSIVLKGS